MENFNLKDVVIENIPYTKNVSSTYFTLKQLVEKLEKDQSFSVPKRYSSHLRSVVSKEFPEIKVKILKVEGSDWIRAYRVL